jgi:hypothetical protein
MKLKTKILSIILLMGFMGVSNPAFSQKGNKKASKRDQAYYDKKKEKDADKSKKGEEEARKAHIKMQSKSTQKQMKRTQRKSKRNLKRSNSANFFQRIFRKR